MACSDCARSTCDESDSRSPVRRSSRLGVTLRTSLGLALGRRPRCKPVPATDAVRRPVRRDRPRRRRRRSNRSPLTTDSGACTPSTASTRVRTACPQSQSQGTTWTSSKSDTSAHPNLGWVPRAARNRPAENLNRSALSSAFLFRASCALSGSSLCAATGSSGTVESTRLRSRGKTSSRPNSVRPGHTLGGSGGELPLFTLLGSRLNF